MASVTPARLDWSGVSLSDSGVGVAPAVLTWTGAVVGSGNGSTVSNAVAVPKLDRLMRTDRLVDGDYVSVRFQTIWQQTMEAIELALAAVNAKVDDNSSVLARLLAVEKQAEAANDNAQAAAVAAETAKEEAASARQEAEQVSVAAGQTFNQIDPALENYYRQQNPGYISP